MDGHYDRICQSGNGGTSDFFHTSGSGIVKPPNLPWATLSPHSGGGMTGFSTWYFTPANFREYIRCTLISPMIAGTAYEVSFWLCNGSNSIITYGTNNIGVAFSTSPLTQSGTSVINATPQCEITSVVYSTTWQKFTFTYVATSAFQYMCIGNFHNDASTTAVLQSGSSQSGAYYYIDDVVVQAESTLPIELTAFDAEPNENGNVSLSWRTASETQNDLFMIERAGDEMKFKSIGSVDGNGNSVMAHDYFFEDRDPIHGWNYYRLLQQDFDGSIHYSLVQAVEVNSEGEREINFYPNPARDIIAIEDCDELAGSRFSVIDLSGEKLLTTILSCESSNLNVSSLPEGYYFLVAENSNHIVVRKLVVQR